MSGGWTHGFSLGAAQQDVTLSFRVKLTQSHAYEHDEASKALVALDGELVGSGRHDYVAPRRRGRQRRAQSVDGLDDRDARPRRARPPAGTR